MPMSWTDAADAKLDFDALAELMGPECSAYAVQHRIRTLKAKAAEFDSASRDASQAIGSTAITATSGNGLTASSSPRTPRKTKAGAASAPGAGTKKRKRGGNEADGDNENNGGQVGSQLQGQAQLKHEDHHHHHYQEQHDHPDEEGNVSTEPATSPFASSPDMKKMKLKPELKA
ncbi:hypothetical protein VTN77DRAFT_1513 [Rasamsonia byssochlamydoides]|uniref:uncharacterized protein n=1 Tax=Rasamsonia byssochlamydoides TaxID=89139 RepID=UPI0037420F13